MASSPTSRVSPLASPIAPLAPLPIPDLLALAQSPECTWSPLRPGVDEHRIYGGDEGDGPLASILRYAPGAQVPYHRHDGYEHVYVLAGSQRDSRGTHRAGALVINSPGSRHEVVSDEGCIALLIWERAVVFTEP
jgi:anti-sigma factor ChrR (cupin superfamily)